MLKPTKRKAFNFLRSYFDVLNELDNDKDKLNFLLSIINKQFLDEDPKDLNFIVNLCYESQRHSIESSVKGWKRVNKIDPTTNPMTNPTTNPVTNPTTNPKEEEEEVKEKEEVKPNTEKSFKERKKSFIDWFNQSKLKYKGVLGKSKVITGTDENNLKRLFESYEYADFEIAIKNLYKSKWAEENNMQTISHFIRIENFNKYLEQGDVNKNLQVIDLNSPVN